MHVYCIYTMHAGITYYNDNNLEIIQYFSGYFLTNEYIHLFWAWQYYSITYCSGKELEETI